MTNNEIQGRLAEIIKLCSECLVLTSGGNVPTPGPGIAAGVGAKPDLSEQEGSGPVLARVGHRCYCTVCKADVYEVVSPVYGRNMGVSAFCNAFKSLGSAPAFSRDLLEGVLKDKQGNTMVDCPVCKGDKSLTIIGEVDRSASKIDTDAPVQSIDPGSMGLGD